MATPQSDRLAAAIAGLRPTPTWEARATSSRTEYRHVHRSAAGIVVGTLVELVVLADDPDDPAPKTEGYVQALADEGGFYAVQIDEAGTTVDWPASGTWAKTGAYNLHLLASSRQKR